MKAWNRLLNILAVAAAGVFAGYSIFVCRDYRTHPGLYAAWSAPWYYPILVHGLYAALVLLAVLLLKLALRRYGKRGPSRGTADPGARETG